MKKMIPTICIFIALILTVCVACAFWAASPATDSGHELKSLWNRYDKACENDLPEKACQILGDIRKQAKSRRLVYDYYDAVNLYPSVASSRNWKLRDSLERVKEQELREFDEPVLLYVAGLIPSDGDEMAEFLDRYGKRLENGSHKIFWSSRPADYKGLALAGFYRNDREYLLTDLFFDSALRRCNAPAYNALKSLFSEGPGFRYPFNALAEYWESVIYNYKSATDEEAWLKDYVSRYAGKAVTAIAENRLLQLHRNELEKKGEATSEQYRALRAEAERIVRLQKSFSGPEAALLEDEVYAENLIAELDTKSIDLSLDGDSLRVMTRNLGEVEVKICSDADGKNFLHSTKLVNPEKSYYRRDTLLWNLPALSDGNYHFFASSGRTESSARLTRYSIAAQLIGGAGQMYLYLADRETGKPVDCADIEIVSAEKTVARQENVRFDGLTPLPTALMTALDESGSAKYLRCSLNDNGILRRSDDIYIYRHTSQSESPEPEVNAQILLDKSAFQPGESVHFKTILYSDLGDGRMKTASAGTGVRMVLSDASGKTVASRELETNGFGSVAGAFELPEAGYRNGNWRLTAYSNERSVNSEFFVVDEYELPAFTLQFERDRKIWLPGDVVPVRGKLSSYAGNSLSDASVGYEVYVSGTRTASGSLEIGQDGSFEIPVSTSRDGFSYSIKVKVTDSAGQTLEFSTRRTVSDDFSLEITCPDSQQAEGRLNMGSGTVAGRRGLPYGISTVILKDGRITPAFSLKDADAEYVVPENGYDYSVSRILPDGSLGKPVLSGRVAAGAEAPELSLRGQPSGIYRLAASCPLERRGSGAVSGRGAVESALNVVLTSEDDRSLDVPVESLFKVYDSESDIKLQLGSGNGAVWATVAVFGTDSRMLYSSLVRLDGIAGLEGSLTMISVPFKAEWPAKVLLKAGYFRRGGFYSYEHEYERSSGDTGKVLSISSFTDECRPDSEYSVRISSEKATEILASVFDKSTEDLSPNVWSTVSPRRPSIELFSRSDSGENSFYSTSRRYYSPVGNSRGLNRNAGLSLASVSLADTDAAEESVMFAESKAFEGNATGVDTSADAVVALRSDFRTVLAFEPFIRTGSDGSAELRFRTSDKLSTYIISLYAHDRDFRNAAARESFVVKMPVSVTLHEPALLYSSDEYRLAASLSNNTRKDVSGMLTAYFYDAGTDGDLSGRTPLLVQSAPVSLKALEAGSVRFSIQAGDARKMASWNAAAGKATLSVKLVFRSTDDTGTSYSDALLSSIDILPDAQTLTESHSAIYRHGMDKDALLRSLEESFVNTSHFGAVHSERNISEMLDEVLAAGADPETDNVLDLVRTLYVRAMSGNGETAPLLVKVLACRTSSGGFGWFAGMKASPLITAVVTEHLAILRDSGKLQLDRSVLEDAVRYMDKAYFGAEGYWFSRISVAQYVYLRSLFPDIALNNSEIRSAIGGRQYSERLKEIKNYLAPKAKNDALNGQIFAKARRASAILNFREASSDGFIASVTGRLVRKRMYRVLDRSIASLKEYAVSHKSGGIYYPNAVMPFRGLLENEAYAHSLICDLMWKTDSCTDGGDGEAARIADGIRLWLMLQKETQQWESTPSFVNAVNSVRAGSPELLETSVIVLSKTYRKPFREIGASGNGMSIEKEFWVLRAEDSRREGATVDDKTMKEERLEAGTILSVGDRIIVRYRIWSGENRSFVRLSAPYNACLRPEDQLSGYSGRNWARFFPSAQIAPQGYREVRSSKISYYFDVYPEENSVIEDSFYVSQAGVFTVPVAEIECLYAPHYRANSAYTSPLVTKW